MNKVSVIMAAYNCEEYVGEAIESILNQTYSNFELIICNDASTDNTLEILKMYQSKDSRIKIITNERNLKSAASRNKCIELSTGDYIAIQDSDDTSDLMRLEKQVNFLEENNQIDFVSSGMKCFDETGVYSSISQKKFPSKKDFLKNVPFCHGSTMFRAIPLKKLGGYRVSKDTIRGQDADLFMRLYSEKYIGANIQELLYNYREGNQAFKRRKYKYRISHFKIRITNFRKMGLFPVGIIYAFRPLLIGLIPRRLLLKLKRIRSI